METSQCLFLTLFNSILSCCISCNVDYLNICIFSESTKVISPQSHAKELPNPSQIPRLSNENHPDPLVERVKLVNIFSFINNNVLVVTALLCVLGSTNYSKN